MGSTFVKMPTDFDSKSVFGNKRKQVAYLQFVPGIVVEVATSRVSKTSGGRLRRINSIIAKPHIGSSAIKNKDMLGVESVYYPLLRGIVDVPVKGDPVLLCTMGGIQYYLGPLNTENKPCFNMDNLKGNDIKTEDVETTYEATLGISETFGREGVARLEKPLIPALDNPLDTELESPILDLHGDMVLEGRHGNSLRIGSRSINPYIIFSNGRAFGNAIETSLDGTIFCMLENGTIREHFVRDVTQKEQEENKPVEFKKYNFTLADDEINPDADGVGQPLRSISKTFTTSLGRGLGPSGEADPDISKTIYGYEENQLFASSDRITFNARKDSMFLASYKFLHLGAGDNITLSTSNTCLTRAACSNIVEAPLIRLSGNVVTVDATERLNLGDVEKGDVMQHAVCGDVLVTMLSAIMSNTIMMCDDVAAAISHRHSGPGVKSSLDKVKERSEEIKDNLESVLSQTVYLEI